MSTVRDDVEVEIDGRAVVLEGTVVSGRKILSQADFDPPDDYVLIEIMDRGTRDVGLDEEIDLHGVGRKVFRAFKSDRAFFFTIDERGYVWGRAEIGEPELRRLGQVPEDRVLVVGCAGGDGRGLKPDDTLDLGKPGTEHLHTRARLITVFYNHEPREIEAGVYSTERLKELFKVPAGYVLDLIEEDGQFRELKPGETLRVKAGMKFVSHAPCGSSS